MYREVIKLEAHSKKEALINLGHALKEVLGCKNDSHIFTRVLVPDENGDIEDPQIQIGLKRLREHIARQHLSVDAMSFGSDFLRRFVK